MRQDKLFCARTISPAALVSLVVIQLLATGCSNNRKVATPAPPSKGNLIQAGMASWYGPKFHGRRTANGERYDMHALTAAHPTLPFGTRLAVRNPRTGQEVVVRVNDRGPFKGNRILDLSYAAANAVGVVRPGIAFVELYLASSRRGRTDGVMTAATQGIASNGYTVQVGAFSENDRALGLHRELARIYPEVSIYADGTWNRVQIGRFQDRNAAEDLRRELAVIGLPAV
ncbi:MAG TPA: septal ring lytic transglycosylase RlpA family protein, partial [Thermoanaerobaculia bacterium]|nr:septal ring lytic transglycosylase RlpA family protein [Thermoanaerobaculia bacterium]